MEENDGLYGETAFADRVEAQDFLEFHILARIAALEVTSGSSERLATLKRRAELVEDRLEEVDRRLFEKLRTEVRSGGCRGASLRRRLAEYGDCSAGEGARTAPGYDTLDLLVNGLLLLDAPPAETKEREPEMVFYQPTPARVVLQVVEKAGLGDNDVFYDLGSGLGQVRILVNLLTGARAKGIEFEPAYCDYARQCAAVLDLPRVEFINLDARAADYSDGTAFFLYTPFRGEMLRQVLERLEQHTRARMVGIYTYGPCTPEVSGQKWLTSVGRHCDDVYRLAAFRRA
jgi:hypothetical protein